MEGRSPQPMQSGPGLAKALDTLPSLLMQSTVESVEGNKVKLRVTGPAGEFKRAIDAAFRKLAHEVRVPGFRPGKAPRKLLEARLGTDVAREQALRDSLPEFYVDAVNEHDVDVIAPPEIEITGGQEEGDVEFEAVVEVRPQVHLTGYDERRGERVRHGRRAARRHPPSPRDDAATASAHGYARQGARDGCGSRSDSRAGGARRRRDAPTRGRSRAPFDAPKRDARSVPGRNG